MDLNSFLSTTTTSIANLKKQLTDKNKLIQNLKLKLKTSKIRLQTSPLDRKMTNI